MTEYTAWLQSPYDKQLHIFPSALGDGDYAEAGCGHCAPTAHLAMATATPCLACCLILGDQMADQHEAEARARRTNAMPLTIEEYKSYRP